MLAKEEAPPAKVLEALAEGYGDYQFSNVEMLTAMTDGITYSISSIGTIVEGVLQTMGFPGETGVLGASIADAYRIIVASSLYDMANGIVEAEVLEDEPPA